MSISWAQNKKSAGSMLEAIGRTPLVRLNKVTSGLSQEILVKVEYFSPTGSLKDRIYHRMITEAVRRKALVRGMTILESSTGNAGIACAFVGGLLGFPVTIVMPMGMSEERKKIIRAYGAQLIELPGAESDVDLCLAKVAELKAKNPGKYWEAGQFGNPDNIDAHYATTGPEVWEQSGGNVDVFVASQGTGGTLTGVGRYLKERKPGVRLFAVEPKEAPILSKGLWGTHKIEGIGDGFVPQNLDLSILEGIVLTGSDESIEMSKRLAKEEGIFCGISSGCNVVAALKLARRYPECGVIVTMINDTGQRYFSTELCGEEREVVVPEREHHLDQHSREQLEKYGNKLVVVE